MDASTVILIITAAAIVAGIAVTLFQLVRHVYRAFTSPFGRVRKWRGFSRGSGKSGFSSRGQWYACMTGIILVIAGIMFVIVL